MKMRTDKAPEGRSRLRWFQFSLRTMLLAIAVFALLLGLLVRFGPHVWWRFGRPRTVCSRVRRVPTGPMPAAETPDSWVRCRLGSLEVDLPPDLAKGFGTTPNASGVACFEGDGRAMLIHLPESSEEMVRLLKAPAAAFPELRELSPTELRLAMYEASWDDFRWSMSRQEFAKHAFLVSFASLAYVENTQRVETLFRDDIEGLLVVAGRIGDFHWYSTDGRAYGSISFVQTPGDIDLSWVRPVCHSVRFTGEIYSDSVTDDELAELFEIVEP